MNEMYLVANLFPNGIFEKLVFGSFVLLCIVVMNCYLKKEIRNQ